ncbi:histidine--tRNA ligase [Halobacillus sp. A5]|uniref:histidine--tRNA ligase n=1 Tax=Halobacillus sp. A5 TaxID=2880263 RepID=UPI0020A64D6F|nr:histidine--tRNA ligase [Halobacillus sp. A5]
MDYQNVKGTEDFLPDAEVVRRKVRRTLEDVFIQYNCLPLETPILNYKDLLASKYAGGAEILKEMYQLSDQGKRELALRYDLTIPFAKAVALNPDVRMPFKRYEIGKVFRDGPVKPGRLREFTQCDVDIVGVESQMGEAELIMMALDAFEELKMDVVVEFNNRKLLNGVLEVFGVNDTEKSSIILTLDKLEKIGGQGVVEELKVKGVSTLAIDQIKSLIDRKSIEIDSFLPYAVENEKVKRGLDEIRQLLEMLEYLGAGDKCIFNPFLARGLEIYSGTVYEIFVPGSNFTSSIGGGGRYDNSIGGLIGTEEVYSTIGISFGLDAVCAALKENDTSSAESDAECDYYVIPLNTEKESLLAAKKLRRQGEKVEVDLAGKSLKKSLNRANSRKAKKTVIVGEEEVQNQQIRIKNMKTGKETIEKFNF